MEFDLLILHQRQINRTLTFFINLGGSNGCCGATMRTLSSQLREGELLSMVDSVRAAERKCGASASNVLGGN
jgi:hypothetical protein